MSDLCALRTSMRAWLSWYPDSMCLRTIELGYDDGLEPVHNCKFTRYVAVCLDVVRGRAVPEQNAIVLVL